MLKLSQPFTTIDPAQGPPTTSRNDGDVSREAAEAEEEQTRDVGVSNMAPSNQTDPSSFDPKYSHQAGKKQEVKESSQRIHTPCPGNRRANDADDRKRLQTTAETVPSEKSHGEKNQVPFFDLTFCEARIIKTTQIHLDGNIIHEGGRASSKIACTVSASRHGCVAQQARADIVVENDQTCNLEISSTKVCSTDRAVDIPFDMICNDDDGNKLLKSSDDLENPQQETNNEAVLLDQKTFSSSALAGVSGLRCSEDVGQSEYLMVNEKGNAHCTKVFKAVLKELDVVGPSNAIGDSTSAVTGTFVDGARTTGSAATSGNIITGVALKKEPKAKVTESVRSFFFYFMIYDTILLFTLSL
jgi:hypothetical protein